MPLISNRNSGIEGYKPSLEEQLGEFPTITTQGRDIALQDAREDAQDNAEYLDWWLKQGLPQGGFPQFPVGPRPTILNENEGTEVPRVGESPIVPATPVLPPSDNRLIISQAPLRPVKESDYITIRPDSGGAYNLPTIGVRPVTLPPMPPPPLPPSPPVNVCLPPPTFRCPC